jgi:hypothetical protein
MDKENMVCAYNEILLILKNKEIPSHATTWMNPEDLNLNEISQPQKANTRPGAGGSHL